MKKFMERFGNSKASDKKIAHPEAKRTNFDARSLAEIEDRPKDPDHLWFVIDPANVFPATVDRIRAVLVANVYPEELNDPASNPQIDSRAAGRIILNESAKVSEDGWRNALTHRNQFSKGTEELKMRAFALDIARRWFTQALHVQVGGDGTGMGLHILDNQKYKVS